MKGLHMSKNSSLFSQILKFFSRIEFENMVKRQNAEYKSKGFSCWQQFVAMLFCQLGKANSLNEITKGLASCEGKLKHLGIEAPSKSTLAYANEHRPWELYQDVFFSLLDKAKLLASTKKRKFRFRSKLYSIDATVIDLCLSMYEWAHFRRAKGAVKLHMRLDHDGYLPDYALITDGKCHEVKTLNQFHFAPGSITVFDKGYNDYTFFGHLCTIKAWFVTRLKSNAVYSVVEKRQVTHKNVLSDKIIHLDGFYSAQNCSHNLRVVEFYDEVHDRIFEFLTNNMKLSAVTIAAIYKERWAIENFFKALKQYLKIKTFVGTSSNAVKTQIWTALISILLLKYMQLKSTFSWSLSNLAALIRMNLFTYRNLWDWINNPFNTPPIQLEEQLSLPI
jgi:IS4 transposase